MATGRLFEHTQRAPPPHTTSLIDVFAELTAREFAFLGAGNPPLVGWGCPERTGPGSQKTDDEEAHSSSQKKPEIAPFPGPTRTTVSVRA